MKHVLLVVLVIGISVAAKHYDFKEMIEGFSDSAGSYIKKETIKFKETIG